MRDWRNKTVPIAIAALVISAAVLLFLLLRPRVPASTPPAFGGNPAANSQTSPLKFTTDDKIHTVARVIDGDTIVLADGTHTRYLGIDSPELAAAHPKGEMATDDCFAKEARALNEKLTLRKSVRLQFTEDKYDRYGRLLAFVYVIDSTGAASFKVEDSVNFKLVQEGAARFYWTKSGTTFDRELISEEQKARTTRSGLWGNCGKVNGECSIKGNIDRNGKGYYHLPGSKYYEATIVNLGRGDRWFCSEEEAVRVGFTKAV